MRTVLLAMRPRDAAGSRCHTSDAPYRAVCRRWARRQRSPRPARTACRASQQAASLPNVQSTTASTRISIAPAAKTVVRIKGEERPWRQWRRVSATHQLDLFADRLPSGPRGGPERSASAHRQSSATTPTNQLRRCFASMAYVLRKELRRRTALRHERLRSEAAHDKPA